MGRSRRPGSLFQCPEQAVKSLTDRYLPAPEQASSTVLGEQPARALGPSVKPRPGLQMGRPARAAPPRRQEPAPLAALASKSSDEGGRGGGGKGLCGPGGGGSICSLGYCLPDGSCPPSPGPGDTGWRLLRRVYKPESASTPLCHYTRTRLLFMEKSVRTRPPRGDRDYCVPGPRQHTPHSCERGWTFKTFPLTPPGAAPVARLASLGDAEPCCHPFLRTFAIFWDTVCGVWLWVQDTQDAPGQPCLPTLGAEVCV